MKITVSFANIFMAEIEKKLIQQSETKLKEWIRYINDVFSLRDCERQEVNRFIKRANYGYPENIIERCLSGGQLCLLTIGI